jgi:hypothetical protein
MIRYEEVEVGLGFNHEVQRLVFPISNIMLNRNRLIMRSASDPVDLQMPCDLPG